MKRLLTKYKPGASVRTQLRLAALMWSVVGVSLLLRGGFVLLGSERAWLLPVAVLVGTVKSVVLLDRAARKNVRRVLQLEDGTCIGGFYSLRMWALVLCMVLLGRLLSSVSLSPEFAGVLYAAIGWALLLSSRHVWKRWFS